VRHLTSQSRSLLQFFGIAFAGDSDFFQSGIDFALLLGRQLNVRRADVLLLASVSIFRRRVNNELLRE
jgi:hypothetical protein